MSDYDSSLPVRTENSGDIDINISDAVNSANKLVINPDGSINVTSTGGGGSTVDLSAASLAALENITIDAGTITLDAATLSALENITVDGGTIALDAATLAALENITVNGTVALDGPTITALQSVTVNGTVELGATTLAALEEVTVSATDLDIRDLVAATDSVAAHLFDETGAAYSTTNPLAVAQVSDQQGTEICEYNTSSSVIKAASVTHTYTTASVFLFGGAHISGSGKLKVEIQVGGATTFVAFNSTSNPNIFIPMDKFCKAAATTVIDIIITNRDNQAQDVYSTLTGLEV